MAGRVRLTDLGRLTRVDIPEGPRWHRPQAMGIHRE